MHFNNILYKTNLSLCNMVGEMRASYQIWLVSRHGEAPLPARVLQLLFLHPGEVGDGDRWGRHHGTLCGCASNVGFGDGRARTGFLNHILIKRNVMVIFSTVDYKY